MATEEITYGLMRKMEGLEDMEEAERRVRAALAEEGFGVLTRIDLQETLAKKVGAEIDEYVILGACNPQLALQGVTAERFLGLVLPCNVVLTRREGAGGVEVAALDPRAMFGIVGAQGMEDLVADATARLERALAAA